MTNGGEGPLVRARREEGVRAFRWDRLPRQEMAEYDQSEVETRGVVRIGSHLLTHRCSLRSGWNPSRRCPVVLDQFLAGDRLRVKRGVPQS
jgi:hypothetical protein